MTYVRKLPVCHSLKHYRPNAGVNPPAMLIYYFYLSKINLFIFINHTPTKFMINKRKIFFIGELFVLYDIML